MGNGNFKPVFSDIRVVEKPSESQAMLPPHASDPWTVFSSSYAEQPTFCPGYGLIKTAISICEIRRTVQALQHFNEDYGCLPLLLVVSHL